MRASTDTGRVQPLQSESRAACRVAYGRDGLYTPRTTNVYLLACSDFLQTCDISAGIKPIEVESSLPHGNSRLKRSLCSTKGPGSPDEEICLAYVMQWNLAVQRELANNLTATIAYVGSRGVHMEFRADDINTSQPTLTSAGYLFPGSTNGVPNGTVLLGTFWNNVMSLIRGTKLLPRDAALSATAAAQQGQTIFESIGCATCHVSTIVTAPCG